MESGLQHHGIKGMRWGVRRTDAQLGNADRSDVAGSKIRRTLSSIAEKARAKQASANDDDNRKKQERIEARKSPAQRARTMDSKDLKAAVDRMNLEKQYATLMAEMRPQTLPRVKKMISDVALNSAKTLLTKEAIYRGEQLMLQFRKKA